MKTTKVQHRSLNQDQLTVLATIYSYRFVTRSLLAQNLIRPNNTSLYSKLQILIKYGYVASHFRRHYKLAGREAEYYITPSGLRRLQETGIHEVTDRMIAAVYKDKAMSQNFIKQVTTIMRIRNHLHTAYEQLQSFTARDLQSLDYFPGTKPSLFLSLKSDETVKRFFLEYIPDSLLDSKIRRKLRNYSTYDEDGAWSATGTPFPCVLLIADSRLRERAIRRHIEREKYRSGTGIRFCTTTVDATTNLTSTTTKIWTDCCAPRELLSLCDQA